MADPFSFLAMTCGSLSSVTRFESEGELSTQGEGRTGNATDRLVASRAQTREMMQRQPNTA